MLYRVMGISYLFIQLFFLILRKCYCIKLIEYHKSLKLRIFYFENNLYTYTYVCIELIIKKDQNLNYFNL